MARLTLAAAIVLALLQISSTFRIKENVKETDADYELRRLNEFIDVISRDMNEENQKVENLKKEADDKLNSALNHIQDAKKDVDLAIADIVQTYLYHNEKYLKCIGDVANAEKQNVLDNLLVCNDDLFLNKTENLRKINEKIVEGKSGYTDCSTINEETSEDQCFELNYVMFTNTYVDLKHDLDEEINDIDVRSLKCVSFNEQSFVEAYKQMKVYLYECVKKYV